MFRKPLLTVFFFGILVSALGFSIFAPRRARQVSAQSACPITLVIDAGHGGEDGGAVSVSGKKESEINLEIALRTEQLAAFVGLKPRMIRTSDVSVHTIEQGSIAQKKVSDLKQRVSLVNSTPDAFLLSIHQNHFAQGKYHGAQVFYAKASDSEAYAKAIQQDLKQTLDPGNHRACKAAQKVYLMEHITCNAVLVECGFLSNLAEEARLQTVDYQKKIAMAMLRTIARYGNRGVEHEI